MNSTDLKEYRGVLEKWQNHSPVVLRNVLKQISERNLTYEEFVTARIYKFLKEMANCDLSKASLLYSKTDYEAVFESAKTILSIIQKLAPLKVASVPEEVKKPAPSINLFEGFKDQKDSYSPRGVVLTAVSKIILNNYHAANGNINVGTTMLDKIREVTIGLEKELYFRNQFKAQPRSEYQNSVKTLLQLLKKDKTGTVTMNILKGSFTTKKAADLNSVDWIDDETLRQQQEIRKAELEAAQIGFYHDLKKREMGQAQGKPCRRCKEEKVYLVEEKQTRRSDEPTTKFYECFNCNDKYRL